MVNRITGREQCSQPAAIWCCRLSDFRPPQLSVLQPPLTFPGASPYGFYVPAGLRYNWQTPGNYTEPASTQPPFGGSWGFFSWSIPGWRPTATPDPVRGYSLLSWAKGFTTRFQEGA